MGHDICHVCMNSNNSNNKDTNLSEPSMNINKNYQVDKLNLLANISEINVSQCDKINSDNQITGERSVTYNNMNTIVLNERDKQQLDTIIHKYRKKAVVNCFYRLKKMKDEAHKNIYTLSGLEEKNYNGKSKENDIDFYPENKYDYVGNMFNNKKDGFGIIIYPISGSVYISKFINDRKIKIGKFKNPKKSLMYFGEFPRKNISYFGILHNMETRTNYTGQWIRAKKYGIGEETYGDDSAYIGEFCEGKKHGIGKYTWADGSNYEGNWVKDKLEGYGIYKFKDGSIYTGQWKSNQMHGFGEFSFPGVKAYFGFFSCDVKSGFGIIYWFKECKFFAGFWKDNKQEGYGKFVSGNKERYGKWESGKKIEKYKDFNEFWNKLDEEEKKFGDIFKGGYNEVGEIVKKIMEMQ